MAFLLKGPMNILTSSVGRIFKPFWAQKPVEDVQKPVDETQKSVDEAQTLVEEAQKPVNETQKLVEEAQKPPASTDEKEKCQERETITLTAPPSFHGSIDLFDNEASSPDLDLVIEGLEKPLKLHKKIISKASNLIDKVLKENGCMKGNERDQIEWMFDTSNKVDRDVLVKALMFCYGDTVSVGTKDGECCADRKSVV